MLPLPHKFDQNEWFILGSIIVAYSIIFFLPKRFPTSLSIILLLYGPTVARISDHLLATAKLDYYRVMDLAKFEFFDLVTYLLYAPFSYLFLYIYDRLKLEGFWILFYIFCCTLAATFFEYINNVLHVFSYNGWKLFYSLSVYLFIQCLTIVFYKYTKQLYKKNI